MNDCGTAEWWQNFPLGSYYEGDGSEGVPRKDTSMTKTKNPFAGKAGAAEYRRKLDALGSEKAGAPADAEYSAFVAAMTGEAAQRNAGVTTTGLDDPGRVDLSEASDDEHYEAYVNTLDGTADRRRAVRMAVEHASDADAKLMDDARRLGHPLPAHLEDRRGELGEYGY